MKSKVFAPLALGICAMFALGGPKTSSDSAVPEPQSADASLVSYADLVQETDEEIVEPGIAGWIWGIYRRRASFEGVCEQSATTARTRLEGHVNLQHGIEVTSLIGSPDSRLCVDGERTTDNIDRTTEHEKKHAAFYVDLANRYQRMLGTVYDDFMACEKKRKELLAEFKTEYANLMHQQAAHTDFCGESRTARQCFVPAEDYQAILDGDEAKPAAIEVPAGSYPCESNVGSGQEY